MENTTKRWIVEGHECFKCLWCAQRILPTEEYFIHFRHYRNEVIRVHPECWKVLTDDEKNKEPLGEFGFAYRHRGTRDLQPEQYQTNGRLRELP